MHKILWTNIGIEVTGVGKLAKLHISVWISSERLLPLSIIHFNYNFNCIILGIHQNFKTLLKFAKI
jgi:hypothetical protein